MLLHANLEDEDSDFPSANLLKPRNIHLQSQVNQWQTETQREGNAYLNITVVPDESNQVPVYKRDPDENTDSIGTTGGNRAVSASGLKFHILREFLRLGYSVLLSDVHILYLQNPFDHMIRDSDIESMSDGYDNMTAYGYNHVFDEPAMGWARYAHTMKVWVYNSAFFYIRATISSIELLDRVAIRLSKETDPWDQGVFNEELFQPSYPGYIWASCGQKNNGYISVHEQQGSVQDSEE
ncbi:hypothetical protein K1719_000962 [Acacia pycnantha]|nr:hypothetical protein K1719_000962 [Acacia pycnantha]